MDISPATVDQLRLGAQGESVLIEADVGNVASSLAEIDPGLRLRFSEKGEYFVVYFEPPDRPGRQELVLTAQECDQRIVKRVREIAAPGYDYGKELERLDREAEKARQDAFRERIGEGAERLYYEIRKAQGIRSKAFISKSIPVPTFEGPFIG